jgi:glycerol-3-phosphate O-acyltransferase
MNACLQRVVDHLSPRIGNMTAANAVRLAASKIGADPDALTEDDLPEIARNVSTILRVFLGTEAASQLEAEIASLEVRE